MKNLANLSDEELLQHYEETNSKIARYNALQTALKLGANSGYGAIGSAFFRLYDIRLATAITLAGQLYIKYVEQKLNQYISKIIGQEADFILAVDTDSVYINFGPLVQKFLDTNKTNLEIARQLVDICKKKIQPYLTKVSEELAQKLNTFSMQLSMKLEKTTDVTIFTAKKKYLMNVISSEGVEYKKPKVVVKGLEAVRSSTPIACRLKIKEMMELILQTNEQAVQAAIAQFKTTFNSLPVEDIAFPRGVSDVTYYTRKVDGKGIPIHVKGAITYNQIIKDLKLRKLAPIEDGDKIKFAYLKLLNPYGSHVISFPQTIPAELDFKEYIDYNMQWEKGFLEPINNILHCIGWNAEPVSDLSKFFG